MTIAQQRQDIGVDLVAFTDVIGGRAVEIIRKLADSTAFSEAEKTEAAEALNHLLTAFKTMKPFVDRLRAEYLGPDFAETI